MSNDERNHVEVTDALTGETLRVPSDEAWLYRNREAMADVRAGLDELARGEQAANPPDLDGEMIPVHDPDGTGETIWLTPDAYELAEEMASILGDSEAMRRISRSIDEINEELDRGEGTPL